MHSKNWLFGFFLLSFSTIGFSQRVKIDSMRVVEQSLHVKKDSNHVNVLCMLSSLYESVNLDSSLFFGNQALKYAEAINF